MQNTAPPNASENADVVEKPKPEPGYMDTPAAAHHTGLSESFLNKLRMTEDGPPFIKVGRRAVRYRLGDLDAWMAGQLVTQSPRRLRDQWP